MLFRKLSKKQKERIRVKFEGDWITLQTLITIGFGDEESLEEQKLWVSFSNFRNPNSNKYLLTKVENMDCGCLILGTKYHGPYVVITPNCDFDKKHHKADYLKETVFLWEHEEVVNIVIQNIEKELHMREGEYDIEKYPVSEARLRRGK